MIRSLNLLYGHLLEHPSDYFGALYLVQLAKEEGVEIPDRVRECLDAIERERKRGKDDAQ